MKKLILPIAAATVIAFGCAYTEDGKTIGQKLDRTVGQLNLAMIEIGGNPTADPSDTTTMSDVAAAMTERALVTTLSVNDAAITAAIKTDLVRDPQLAATKIAVEAKDGVVTLAGTAHSEDARRRAEHIANTNKGVLRVDNRVTVKPV